MDEKKNYEPDIAVSTMTGGGGPPVPEGHIRNYCEKCRAVRFCHHCLSIWCADYYMFIQIY